MCQPRGSGFEAGRRGLTPSKVPVTTTSWALREGLHDLEWSILA